MRELLTTLDDVLEDASTDDVTECGLRALHQGLADVGDAEGSLVWGSDVVVDDGGQMERHVVLGHAHLLWHLCTSTLAPAEAHDFARVHTHNLDLDIDLDETFAERVDLDEAGIDGAIESTELGDQAHVTLRHRLVRVRTADAAGEGAHGSNARSQSVDCARRPSVSLAPWGGDRVMLLTHASVPAMVALVALSHERLGIAGLQVLSSRRLHVDHGVVEAAGGVRRTKSAARVGRPVLRTVGLIEGVAFGDGAVEAG